LNYPRGGTRARLLTRCCTILPVLP
jgi:hypothetical protein